MANCVFRCAILAENMTNKTIFVSGGVVFTGFFIHIRPQTLSGNFTIFLMAATERLFDRSVATIIHLGAVPCENMELPQGE